MRGRQRTFTTSVFYGHLRRALAIATHALRAREALGKQFSAKLMLAASEVNGCRMCSYFHTSAALSEGASEQELSELVGGDFGALSPEQLAMVVFAQHYADVGGSVEPEAWHGLVRKVGHETAVHALALTKVIMVGNIHGISLDAVWQRLQRRPLAESRLADELVIGLGVLFMVPVALVQNLVGSPENPWERAVGRQIPST